MFALNVIASNKVGELEDALNNELANEEVLTHKRESYAPLIIMVFGYPLASAYLLLLYLIAQSPY